MEGRVAKGISGGRRRGQQGSFPPSVRFRYAVSAPQYSQVLRNDALASGNAAYVAQAFGVIARARGMAAVARQALCKSLSQDGDPRLTTLLEVLSALGVTLHAEIEPAA